MFVSEVLVGFGACGFGSCECSAVDDSESVKNKKHYERKRKENGK